MVAKEAKPGKKNPISTIVRSPDHDQQTKEETALA
jgi:hypothetical protein